MISKRNENKKRSFRIRSKIKKSPNLRLSAFRSSKHIYVQVIDDKVGKTILSASSHDKSLKEIFGSGTAVVILAIKSFNLNNVHYNLIENKDPLSELLKKKIMDIQYNLEEDAFNWRYKIPKLTFSK